jgi:hypothetical protein
MSKYLEKTSHVYLHILCAHAQFREKQTFFVGYEKRQKVTREGLF